MKIKRFSNIDITLSTMLIYKDRSKLYIKLILSVYGRSLCLNLFRPFCCIDPKDFKINWSSNRSILSVPDGGYSKKGSWALRFYYVNSRSLNSYFVYI